MKHVGKLVVLVGVALLSGCASPLSSPTASSPAIAHMVYFTLHDNSPSARDALVNACYQYLRDHPGVAFFAAGDIVADHQRDVNVRDWDVGLHIVFADQASHDRYQDAETHHRFIEENKANWKQVRVFDSFIRQLPTGGKGGG